MNTKILTRPYNVPIIESDKTPQKFWRRVITFVKAHATAITLIIVLSVAVFSHGYNMLNYPYYESDEGTYTSQAWSILTKGELAPYTYWYDHPPLGWATIALWAWALPQDLFTFGTSIDTGRVLMLIVHLISVTLIFYITKRWTKSNMIALFVCLFYSLSPLAIYFRRRVLLDNLMNMWLLASLALLFVKQIKLRHFALSGLFFAFSFLTKISAMFFGPALLLIVAFGKYPVHRMFRIASWLSVAILSVIIYPIYSILKGEFLPASITGGEHVSLIESLLFQMGRGNGISFYQKGSDFLIVLQDWMLRDTPYIISLCIIIVFGLWAGIKNNTARALFIGSLCYIFFLIRGNVVINFYIIPLISFLSLLAGVILFEIKKHMDIRWIDRPRRLFLLSLVPVLLITLIGFYYTFGATTKHLYANEVSNQRLAMNWIKDNLPEDADIIIDSIMLVELRDSRYRNSKTFDNAEWFYKVSRDPEIRDQKYNGTWRTFDYIALTHEMLKQLDRFEKDDISLLAFEHSLPTAKWVQNSTSYVDEQKFITTNGDWAMIYNINGNTKNQLVDSWNYYKKNFIHSYGQVIDPAFDVTTSEGQSYAMLRAVWMNDKETFNGVWDWTRHHLQHRVGDRLLSWQWKNNKLLDATNASDADQDIAMALLFASKAWTDTSYSDAAKEIISDIWRMSVVQIDGTLYMLPMNEPQARAGNKYIFNPSYLSPAHYRIFASVDPLHDWLKLADDSYKTLNRIALNSSSGLPANWYLIDNRSGALSSASSNFGTNADMFGYDAFRTFWRIALDEKWYNNREARSYLEKQGDFLLKEKSSYVRLPNFYDPKTGIGTFADQSLAVHTGYLIALDYANKNIANKYYESIFLDAYNPEIGYWKSTNNYYDQNWVWLGSGLFNGDIQNLWERP